MSISGRKNKQIRVSASPILIHAKHNEPYNYYAEERNQTQEIISFCLCDIIGILKLIQGGGYKIVLDSGCGKG